MAFISICIPTHEMSGLGHQFLKDNFEILQKQTFTDFDIVIADHSKNDAIKDLCQEYAQKLTIQYFRNTNDRGIASANTNFVLTHATGTLIKILYLDDFLFHDRALEDIAINFDLEKDHWLVTACNHTKDGVHFFKPFYPRYHPRIYIGNNTISSPSVVTVKNDTPLLLDEKLIWLMDCDYYEQYHARYGNPKIVSRINVTNRIGSHQATHTLTTFGLKIKELKYVLDKYHHGFLSKQWYVSVYTFRHFVRAILSSL